MKKLSELKISPAPWKVIEYVKRTDSTKATEGALVFDDDGEEKDLFEDDLTKISNARFIAASPKIYEAAWKTDAVLTRLFETDEFAALLASGAAAALIACRDLLRAALKEAGGEEVSDGK